MYEPINLRLPDSSGLTPLEKLYNFYGKSFVLDSYEEACDNELEYRKRAYKAKTYVDKVLAIEGMLQATFAMRIHEHLMMGEFPEEIIAKLRYPKFIEEFMPILKLQFGRGIEKLIYEEFWFVEDKKGKYRKK